jgi:hypothetical protein
MVGGGGRWSVDAINEQCMMMQQEFGSSRHFPSLPQYKMNIFAKSLFSSPNCIPAIHQIVSRHLFAKFSLSFWREHPPSYPSTEKQPHDD